jgi:N-acetylglutamate synthase-like GNAT family acetyltransferase
MAVGQRKDYLKIKTRERDDRRSGRNKSDRNKAVVLAAPQLHIRPLELIDSRRVVDLVYKFVYIETSKTIAIESIQRVDFLTFNVLTSLIVYLLTESMWIANIWFFVWPFLGYMYITSSMGGNEYNKGDDTRPGASLHDYWTENDRYMLIAELNTKIVGAVCMINKSPVHGVIVRVVADPDAASYDVKERLLRTLMEQCQERGIERLDFVTSYAKKHVSAPKLYKRLGFVLERTFEVGSLPFFKVKFYDYRYLFEPEENDETETETRLIGNY